MIQEASDADIMAHAEATIERSRASATEGVAADLLAEAEVLIGALRRHQPPSSKEGWNDAWTRFDSQPPKA